MSIYCEFLYKEKINKKLIITNYYLLQIFYSTCLFVIFFSIKLFLCNFKGGRIVEVKNEAQEEIMREVGHLLLEVKCLARLGALASDSCIIDDELQMQDNLEYYFALKQVANLIRKIEHLLFD